jgi:hypothetical protein
MKKLTASLVGLLSIFFATSASLRSHRIRLACFKSMLPTRGDLLRGHRASAQAEVER